MEGARRPVAEGPGRLFSLRGARFIWKEFLQFHMPQMIHVPVHVPVDLDLYMYVLVAR